MKKNLLIISSSMALPITNKVCVTCNKAIQEGIYNSSFYPNLFIMLSAFIVVGIIVAVFSALAVKRYHNRIALNADSKEVSNVPLVSAAIVLGIGIGGFIDGILLHQLLQWHEMLSNKLPPTTLVNKSINMFWDGVFHFYTLLITVIGIILMWKLLRCKAINQSGYLLSGGLLLGWGLFNCTEGIIDHHILKLHNVRETGASESWNIGFLAFSFLLLIVGWFLIRIGIKQNAIPSTIIRSLYN